MLEMIGSAKTRHRCPQDQTELVFLALPAFVKDEEGQDVPIMHPALVCPDCWNAYKQIRSTIIMPPGAAN